MRSLAWLSWSLMFWSVAACAEGIASRTDDDDAKAGAAGASNGNAGQAGAATGGAGGTSTGGGGTSAGGTSSGGAGASAGGTSSGGAGASAGGTSGGGAGASAGGTSSGGAGTSAGGTSSGGAGTSAGGTSSGGAGASAGTGGSAGATCSCTSPPAPVCLVDGVTRRTFTSPGTCSGSGSGCAYPHSDTTCPFGCAAGACTADPCTAVSCSSPPTPVCNGSSVRTYSGPGTCGGSGACTYPFTDGAACPFGCAAGACNPDPCAGVACNSPPTPVCNGSSVRTYSGPGTCGGSGACTYPFTDGAACPFGCTGGACNPDPCAGVTCTTPPPPSCFDANTLRTSTGTGTCQSSTGACQFPTTDQPCPGGCAAGVCKQCATAAHCMANEWCNAGTCATCGAAACGNGACDCGETAASCAADCAPCPTALKIGDWASSDDGWTYDGLWKRSGGAMVAGSTNSYCNNYTQNLTYNTNVDLSTCSAPTITFQVKLADDVSWTPRADKSERLYVQCSGDAGANWTNLTPVSFPPNQSACATSYCNSGTSPDRSFPLTSQTIPLPAACLTTQARFRFQAKGACAWRMQSPGWTVDGVTIN